MIITRTPLRISFVGGGSDLPWFYEEEPGAVVAAAIDKYVYVTYSPKYEGTFRAAYSRMETVSHIEDLQHELIRETLKGATSDPHSLRGCEVHSIADIPGGTGLGSSSAFTVGLVRAMYPGLGVVEVAMAAIGIEIGKCHKHIGVQDQLVTAIGGLYRYGFGPRLGEHIRPARIAEIACDLDLLNSHLMLFDTGLRRSDEAGQMLSSQWQDRERIRELAAMAEPFAKALEDGNMHACGTILDAAWYLKRKFVATPQIDGWWHKTKDAGAWGCKLCGAGGGGFLLILAPPGTHTRIETALLLRRVPIRVGVPGTTVIYQD